MRTFVGIAVRKMGSGFSLFRPRAYDLQSTPQFLLLSSRVSYALYLHHEIQLADAPTSSACRSVVRVYGGRPWRRIQCDHDDDISTDPNIDATTSHLQSASSSSIDGFALDGTQQCLGRRRLEQVGRVHWLGALEATLSAFLLTNQFVGPWPEDFILDVPQRTFLLIHFLSGMLFGGGIILTTCIEWLVVDSTSSGNNKDALLFWFQRVPQLDAFLVVPALTSAVVSGVALAVQNYERLSFAPLHIRMSLYTLVLFALCWATTDVTTQAPARTALQAWATGPSQEDTDENNKVNDEAVPRVVQLRRISNVVSCLLVVLLYAIMTLKPGYP
jgi:hypothetical protein